MWHTPELIHPAVAAAYLVFNTPGIRAPHYSEARPNRAPSRGDFYAVLHSEHTPRHPDRSRDAVTRVLLAGGGTAGHVNPLLAVADALRNRAPSDTVLVLGTADGLESRLVPERGYVLEIIPRVAFPRRPSAHALTFPLRLHAAVQRTRSLIRAHRIDVVVGFGGYVATPAYLAAQREGVPYVVHEANARPGLANVWGARRAAAIGTVFPMTRLPRAVLVGMPLRAEIATLDRAATRAEAARAFGLSARRPVLLAFGGSAGASKINGALIDAWPAIRAAGWQLLHVTGDAKRGDVAAPDRDPDRVVVPYVQRMDLAYALADFVLCRSGSATVSELSALGIPAAYVPYAVGNGEQELNASPVVRAGGALLLEDATLDAAAVVARVLPCLQNAAARAHMGRVAATLGTRDGTEQFVALIDAVSGAAMTA